MENSDNNPSEPLINILKNSHFNANPFKSKFFYII